MTRPRTIEPRQHQVSVRFSTRELVRLRSHAALTGLTITEFGRRVMLRRPRRRRGEPAPVTLPEAILARWRDEDT